MPGHNLLKVRSSSGLICNRFWKHCWTRVIVVKEAEVDKLGVQTEVELAVETEVDRPNVGAKLVVGTGTGETEVGKSDSEADDFGAEAVETEVEGALTGTTEAEGTVTEAAVAIVTGPVEDLKGAVAATVGQDVGTAAVERTEITGGQVEITGGLVTTGEVTEAVVLGTSSEAEGLVSESSSTSIE